MSKLLLLMCVVSVCVPAAFAQTAKGLKYVPQAVKGAGAVPYVVSPKLPPMVRTNLAVPVVRPNVTAQVAPAVERAVAAKIAVALGLGVSDDVIHERAIQAASLATRQLKESNNLTTENYINTLVWFYNKIDPYGTGNIYKSYEKNLEKLLEQIEHFIAENNRFPSQYAEDEFESWLRKSFNYACSNLYYPLSDTSSKLLSLKEKWVKPHK